MFLLSGEYSLIAWTSWKTRSGKVAVTSYSSRSVASRRYVFTIVGFSVQIRQTAHFTSAIANLRPPAPRRDLRLAWKPNIGTS
jgi:hypothetical protein